MRNKFLIILLSICFSDYQLIEIDATSYSEWIYFSFSSGEIVEIENPMDSNEWDLGVMRNHFRTNSGLSGSEIGGAYVDSSQTWTTESWESITEVPEDAIFSPDGMLDTIYDLETHEFSTSPGSVILEEWGWVDIDNNYEFNYNNYMFFVRTAIGEYVKFWPYSYYNDEETSGYISIAYETGIQNNSCNNSGDVNFDGLLNLLDIIIIRDHIISFQTLSSNEQCQADINYDSLIDIFDIVIILNLILS